MKYLSLVLCGVLLVGCTESNLVSSDVSDEGPSVLASLNTTASSKARGNSSSDAYTTYNVTITNMTDSQPFSPGVIVTHDPSLSLFETGSAASEGIRQIAENGNPGPATASLAGVDGISDALATDAPIHRKGGPGATSVTWQVQAKQGDVLSTAVMLICTNDGFVGLNSVALPKGNETKVYFANAYDSGTEANDELRSSIVDPCNAIGPVAVPADGSNDNPQTEGVVTLHDNIQGTGDLDASAYGWGNKVAKIKIKRVK